MNQTRNTVQESSVTSDDNDVSLIDVMIVLARYKKLILGLPLAAAILSVAISFVLPNVYKATTKLLPPQQAQAGASALLAQLGGMASMAAGAAGLKNPSDLYIGMLKSRTVADRLIAQFGLKKVYETESQEKARERLEENTVITAGKDGLISIQVEDKDSKLVSPLANAYVAELLRLTKVLAVTEAAQRRMFFEEQLELSKNNLAKAEMSLKEALDSSGVISVDIQSRGVLETVARLRAQASAQEIQRDAMKAFVTPDHPDYRRIDEELSSLRAELSRLENGRASTGPGSAQREGKQGGVQNIQRLRDVKYYQMLYELLAKQYEAARLDEAKDPSVIQVLDPAIEPERKFKPRRTLIVLLSTLLAAFAAVVWAFLSEAKQRAVQEADGAARWSELKSHLRFK